MSFICADIQLRWEIICERIRDLNGMNEMNLFKTTFLRFAHMNSFWLKSE